MFIKLLVIFFVNYAQPRQDHFWYFLISFTEKLISANKAYNFIDKIMNFFLFKGRNLFINKGLFGQNKFVTSYFAGRFN